MFIDFIRPDSYMYAIFFMSLDMVLWIMVVDYFDWSHTL